MTMQRTHQVAILAVGTELTSGQIINSNAAWLSEQLTTSGLETIFHLTIADDRQAILWGLESAASQAPLIFIMGGLGPTRDDFTREVISEWCGLPLQWDQASWEHLVKRLAGFGGAEKPSQKQQCYFPQGAEILVNDIGTANAFALKDQEIELVALPGPPSELKWLWTHRLSAYLSSHFPPRPPSTLYRWDCLGKGESDLGDIVEAALEGSGFQTGYRAHFPYIEVKVWVPENAVDPGSWIDALESAIAPWIGLKNGVDAAESLCLALPNGPIYIHDEFSQGLLAGRLGPAINSVKADIQLTLQTHWQSEQLPPPKSAPDSGVQLWIQSAHEPASLDKHGIHLGLQTSSKQYTHTLKSQYPDASRARRQLTEKALLLWTQWLTG